MLFAVEIIIIVIIIIMMMMMMMMMMVIIIIIIIIIIINFVYVSGYLAYIGAHNLAYRLIGDTTRTNRNKMLKIINIVV